MYYIYIHTNTYTTKIVQDVLNWCIQNVSQMCSTFQQTFVYMYIQNLKVYG